MMQTSFNHENDELDQIPLDAAKIDNCEKQPNLDDKQESEDCDKVEKQQNSDNKDLENQQSSNSPAKLDKKKSTKSPEKLDKKSIKKKKEKPKTAAEIEQEKIDAFHEY